MTMPSCQECGAAFKTRQASAMFCSPQCRKAFDNRRMKRGAELYDLLMVTRFDRSDAGRKGTQSELSSLASAYRRADKVKRAGRKSWIPLERRMQTLAWYTSDEGDRR